MSEYILTGNINSSWSSGNIAEETYQKRNWNMYINENQYGAEAGVLTKGMLDEWYNKYTDATNADILIEETFQKIYQEPYIKYQNMIENFTYYWIGTVGTGSSYLGLYRVRATRSVASHSWFDAYGLRIIVTLDSNAQFTATKAGTKTVTGGNMDTYGGDQTYNVWNLY